MDEGNIPSERTNISLIIKTDKYERHAYKETKTLSQSARADTFNNSKKATKGKLKVQGTRGIDTYASLQFESF